MTKKVIICGNDNLGKIVAHKVAEIFNNESNECEAFKSNKHKEKECNYEDVPAPCWKANGRCQDCEWYY